MNASLKKLIVAGAVVLLILGGVWGLRTSSEKSYFTTQESLAHFIEVVSAKGKAIEGYEKMGLGGEVDGFTLMKAYPGLLPSDFTNVIAYQGEYFQKDGKLFYSGHAASNSAVILPSGMKVLLENIARRLKIEPESKENIDTLVSTLEKNI